MATTQRERHRDNHDWHSKNYVAEWIARDATREGERRLLLRRMLQTAPFDHAKPIDVLNVGAGYGFVTDELLKMFPAARVVWQDYSKEMLAAAKTSFGDKVRYVVSDLTDPQWTKDLGGPFDLAVSAIAIHNLFDEELIFNSYRAIERVLKPGGYFLNCDRFPDGPEPHAKVLKEAGFERVQVIPEQGVVAIMVAGPKK